MHEVNSTTIKSLHTNIAKAIGEVTGAILQVVCPSHQKGWEKLQEGANVKFELSTVENNASKILCDYIDRDLGGRSFAFRLIEQPEEEPTLWAGWYEEWKATEGQKFNLVGLSWTFYWGVYLRPRPIILRAEWDSLKYRNQRAAQPHWHINSALLIDSYHPIVRPSVLAVAPQEGDDLEELPEEIEEELEEIAPTGIQELSLTGMHLGMGGWEHSPDHPDCWRNELPTTWSDVTNWVKKTLVYATEQFTEEFFAAAPIE
jgi:hypothetical protein